MMDAIKVIDEFYKFGKVLWYPVHRTLRYGVLDYDLQGPNCPKCKASLKASGNTEVHCELCEVGYKLEPNIDVVRRKALKAYVAKLKQNFPVYALDLPPSLVKSEDENKDYWIEARLGQKSGKLMGIVYFGKKARGKQNKKDYSQVFVDFEDEQMRFDKGNKNPLDIIGKLKAEFLGSSHTSKKK